MTDPILLTQRVGLMLTWKRINHPLTVCHLSSCRSRNSSPSKPARRRGEAFDLYLIRDEEVVFYVGKSDLAFFRIWQHILDGYKGRSTIGRFILCNWRASMNFTIELMNSRTSQFADLENDLSAIEKSLIIKHSPCFNVVSNPTPTPLPEKYLPTTSPIQHARRLGKVIREASYVLKGEKRKGWLAELDRRLNPHVKKTFTLTILLIPLAGLLPLQPANTCLIPPQSFWLETRFL